MHKLLSELRTKGAYLTSGGQPTNMLKPRLQLDAGHSECPAHIIKSSLHALPNDALVDRQSQMSVGAIEHTYIERTWPIQNKILTHYWMLLPHFTKNDRTTPDSMRETHTLLTHAHTLK
jgi:hypothetical protein